MDARDLKGKLPERVYSVRDGLPNSTILRIFLDSRGDIWAGTADGLGHWTRATGRWQGFRTSRLNPRIHGHGRRAFVCGGQIRRRLGRYVSRAAWCVFADLATSSSPMTFPEAPSIRCFRIARDDCGSDPARAALGGWTIPRRPNQRSRHYGLEQGLSSEHVFSLVEDDGGRIYVAGGRGVDRLDPKTATLRHFTSSSGLPPGDTQFLFRDRDGNIWFASFYGLARYRPEPDQTVGYACPAASRTACGRRPISDFGDGRTDGDRHGTDAGA